MAHSAIKNNIFDLLENPTLLSAHSLESISLTDLVTTALQDAEWGYFSGTNAYLSQHLSPVMLTRFCEEGEKLLMKMIDSLRRVHFILHSKTQAYKMRMDLGEDVSHHYAIFDKARELVYQFEINYILDKQTIPTPEQICEATKQYAFQSPLTAPT